MRVPMTSLDGMYSKVIATIEHKKSIFVVDIRLWKDETLLLFEARLVGDM